MTAARPHAPSSQRIAEARAQGHLPNAPLAGVAGALLSLVACGFWLGPGVARNLVTLLRDGFTAAAAGQLAEAHTQARALANELFTSLLLAATSIALSIGLAVWLAQGPSFYRGARGRTSFAPLRPSRTASALFGLGVLALTWQALSRWSELEPNTLSAFARELAPSLCVLTLACAAIDVAFARARWFASLFMTRRELLTEQREAFGAPEVRAARAEVRRSDT